MRARVTRAGALLGLVALCGCPKHQVEEARVLPPPPPVPAEHLGRYLVKIARHDAGMGPRDRWCYLDVEAQPGRPDRVVVSAWRPDDPQPLGVQELMHSGSNLRVGLARRFEVPSRDGFGTTAVTEVWLLSGRLGKFPPPPAPRPKKPKADHELTDEERAWRAVSGEASEETGPPAQDMTPQQGYAGQLRVEVLSEEREAPLVRTYRFVAFKTDLTQREALEAYERGLEAKARREEQEAALREQEEEHMRELVGRGEG